MRERDCLCVIAMKRKLMIGITVFSLLMTGCGANGTAPAEEAGGTPNAEQTVETGGNSNESEAAETDAAKEFSALEQLINEGRINEYVSVLPNYMSMFNESQMTELFAMHHKYLTDHLGDAIDIFYSDAVQGLSDEIVSASGSEAPHIVYGADRYQLLDKIQDEAHREVLKSAFDSGYAIMRGEGVYYPQVDYVELQSLYSGKVSDTVITYCDIMAEELKNPLTVEEHLNVDLETLKDRLYQYETFLTDHAAALKAVSPEMVEQTRILFNVALWNTVNPNTFNGLLGDDYYPKQEAVDFYQAIVSDNSHPLTTEAATRILKVIEEKREDMFGSLEKTEQLFPISEGIRDDINLKVDSLY